MSNHGTCTQNCRTVIRRPCAKRREISPQAGTVSTRRDARSAIRADPRTVGIAFHRRGFDAFGRTGRDNRGVVA